MLQLSGVGKRFGHKLLFDGLDWLITPKERTGLVEDSRDFLDLLVEQSERGGIRQHQARSPLVWDFWAILSYLSFSAVFFYIGLIPDLATMRDRARPGLGRTPRSAGADLRSIGGATGFSIGHSRRLRSRSSPRCTRSSASISRRA